ncbi:MAG: hypothetical protein ACT4PQ_07800 [Betaproteobacteria bacterium]
MNVQEFERTTLRDTPPSGLSPMLEALWCVRKGDWKRAHAIVQEHEDETTSALVHAHLHRVEGDLSNAGYWYRRAGRKPAEMTPEDEWKALAAHFLEVKKQ